MTGRPTRLSPYPVVSFHTWAGLLLLLAALTAQWWLPTDDDVYHLPITNYYGQEVDQP